MRPRAEPDNAGPSVAKIATFNTASIILYNGRLALFGTAIALICADYFLHTFWGPQSKPSAPLVLRGRRA
jgi:hypothetical protein